MQHSSRGDKFVGFARVEHGASVICDGDRLEYVSGETMALNLEARVPCSSSDLLSLTNITKYPLIGKCTNYMIVHVHVRVCRLELYVYSLAYLYMYTVQELFNLPPLVLKTRHLQL